MSRLLALFIIVPALELYLLIQIGTLIGALETFGIIVITGLIGSYLAKSEGLATLRRFQEKLATGKPPGKELADGAIILVSGAFLLTPGVITDVIGLMGLFPLTRPLIRNILQPWLASLLTGRFSASTVNHGSNVNYDPFGGENPGVPYRTNTSEADETPGSIVSGSARTRPRRND